MKSFKYSVLVLSLLAASSLVRANDGQVLFVSGNVIIERGDAETYPRRGDPVLEGDTIKTGSNGRAHIRMSDNTLLSLKPETTFAIDEFEYAGGPSRVAAGVEQASVSRPRSQRAPRSFFRLVAGGFRAITGVIGRSDRSAFRVQTPVATIGIRGTTFRAACVAACKEGLVFGVTEGSIVATTNAGSLVLFNDEFGYVQSRNAPPQQLATEPPSLRDDAPRPGARRGQDMEGEKSDQGAQQGGEQQASRSDDQRRAANQRMAAGSQQRQPSSPAERGPAPPSQSQPNSPDGPDTASSDSPVIAENATPGGSGFRSVALGFGGDVAHPGVRAQNSNNTPEFLVRLTANNSLAGTSLPVPSANEASGGEVRATIGTDPNAQFQIVDTGFDSDLRLAWGRWAGGTIRVTEGSRNFDSSTDAAAAHWVVSGLHNGDLAIPTTGSREFEVVGATSPTNPDGVVGEFGNATLRANFSNSTIETELDLRIDDTPWQASGNGQIGSGSNAHLFAGSFGQVRVGESAGGNGDFAGFFTPMAGGAGLTYGLNGADGGSVAGAVVFRDASPPSVDPGGMDPGGMDPGPDPGGETGAIGGSGGRR